MVRIIRPPLCGDRAAEVPQNQWHTLLVERQRFCSNVVPRDCRMLLFFVEDAAASNWLGFADRETYIREGLGMDPEMVSWALEGLKKTDPEEALSLDLAVVLPAANIEAKE